MRRAALALAFFPALVCAALVHAYAVDIPIWDDLERAKLLSSYAEGDLDLSYIYSPHIEHRIVMTRLITLLGAALGHRGVLFDLGAIFAIVFATAVAVHALLRRTFPERPGLVVGLTLGANLLLFSPLQWETFLWAIQTSFVLPQLCLVVALLVLTSQLATPVRFAGAFLCALVASHSYSHGLLLWGAVPAFELLRARGEPGHRRTRFVGAWLVATVVVLVPYFTIGGFRNLSDHGYVEVGEPPPGLDLGGLPARVRKAATFFVYELGSPLARTGRTPSDETAPWWAGLQLALLAAVVLLWLARWRNQELRDRALPWLTLGGFAVVACTAPAISRTALNKAAFGLVPHYVTVSLWLPLALGVLISLFVSEERRRKRLAPYAAFAAGLVLFVLLLQWPVGVTGMRAWKTGRLQARAALLFLPHFEPEYVRRLDGDLETLRRLAGQLDRAGYLHPSMLPDTRLSHFAESERPADGARIERARLGDRLVASGFAWLHEHNRPADAVLVTVNDPNGERVVVDVAEVRGFPPVSIPEADHIFNEVKIPTVADFSRWRSRIPLEALPDRERLDVELWALDAEDLSVQPLAQRLVVVRDGAGAAVAIVE